MSGPGKGRGEKGSKDLHLSLEASSNRVTQGRDGC